MNIADFGDQVRSSTNHEGQSPAKGAKCWEACTGPFCVPPCLRGIDPFLPAEDLRRAAGDSQGLTHAEM